MMRPSSLPKQSAVNPRNTLPPVKRKMTQQEVFYFKILMGFMNMNGPQTIKYDMSHIEYPTAAFVQKCFVAMIEAMNGRPMTQVETQRPLKGFNAHSNFAKTSSKTPSKGSASANRVTLANPQGAAIVYYNPTVDNIFWNAKSFFPENSNLLNYTVLLAPAKDIKSTYQSLSYMTAFMVFCDGICERFTEITDELNLENNRKTSLCSEIEEIKEKIAKKMMEIGASEQEIPVLEATVAALKAEILNLEQESMEINQKALKDKAKYDAAAESNRNLELLIEQHLKTKSSLQNEIIPDVDEFLKSYNELKLGLDKAHKLRDDLGIKIQLASTEDELMHDVIDAAETCMNVFLELIDRMNKLADDARLCSEIAQQIKKLTSEIKAKRHANEELKNSENQINETHLGQRHVHKQKMAEKGALLQELKTTVSNYDKKKALVRAASEVCQKHKLALETKIDEINVSIEECDFYCKVNFPEQINEIEKNTRAIVAEWRKKFREIIDQLKAGSRKSSG